MIFVSTAGLSPCSQIFSDHPQQDPGSDCKILDDDMILNKTQDPTAKIWKHAEYLYEQILPNTFGCSRLPGRLPAIQADGTNVACVVVNNRFVRRIPLSS